MDMTPDPEYGNTGSALSFSSWIYPLSSTTSRL